MLWSGHGHAVSSSLMQNKYFPKVVQYCASLEKDATSEEKCQKVWHIPLAHPTKHFLASDPKLCISLIYFFPYFICQMQLGWSTRWFKVILIRGIQLAYTQLLWLEVFCILHWSNNWSIVREKRKVHINSLIVLIQMRC